MILDTYRCDRCGDQEDILEPDEDTVYIRITAPCAVHGFHDFDYCGWECAMHACAARLDEVEAHEAAHDEAE